MNKRMISTTLAGVALATSGLITASAATASPAAALAPGAAAPCPAGNWSASTLGIPAGAHPGMTGVAVFRKHNTNVFSVRMSTAAKRALYVGSITSTDGALTYQKVRTEAGDVVRQVSPHRIVFAMSNAGHLDGIDVRVKCGSNVTFGFGYNGHRLSTSHIIVGGAAANPATNPFTEVKS